jgi:hypothetical protein
MIGVCPECATGRQAILASCVGKVNSSCAGRTASITPVTSAGIGKRRQRAVFACLANVTLTTRRLHQLGSNQNPAARTRAQVTAESLRRLR